MQTEGNDPLWEEFNATPADSVAELESDRDEWRRLALALAEDWDALERSYEELDERCRRLEDAAF